MCGHSLYNALSCTEWTRIQFGVHHGGGGGGGGGSQTRVPRIECLKFGRVITHIARPYGLYLLHVLAVCAARRATWTIDPLISRAGGAKRNA